MQLFFVLFKITSERARSKRRRKKQCHLSRPQLSKECITTLYLQYHNSAPPPVFFVPSTVFTAQERRTANYEITRIGHNYDFEVETDDHDQFQIIVREDRATYWRRTFTFTLAYDWSDLDRTSARECRKYVLRGKQLQLQSTHVPTYALIIPTVYWLYCVPSYSKLRGI